MRKKSRLRSWGILRSEWNLTKLGEAFYYGEAPVMTPAAHVGGKTLPPDHPAWETHDVKPTLKLINEIEATHYKRRPEYQEEKAGGIL